ncbi:DotH/IcmK family type IV secretion protein [Pseudomonas fluorescens]|uniref:DotH/IcmK family type IV secretion protein n=1 Tax=Pseudomonas fluorescens TaxID=294 RepID=UPI001BEAF2C8|nr:DotH/IcmK family type IV secretion protein [Pseudomonas fluorescens]MBT2375553.1 DotH/IcmK family type IV secretion protein [Pseudomonas fluorescens]
MKTTIALALWLAAGGYAWADETASPQAAPTASAAAPVPQTTATAPTAAPQLSTAAPSGWVSGVSLTPAAPAVNVPNPAAAAPDPGRTAAAPAPSGNDPLPPPVPSALFQQARETISPLTPQEIRQLRGQVQDINQAIDAPQVTVVPRISALTVNLSPGASLPLIRTAVNYPSSLSWMDSTGAPWKLGAAPISGNPDFTAYWIPNSPVMIVLANKPFSSGNVTVYLEGLAVPIVLNVTSGEPDTKAGTWTVDSRLDMRVPGRGPAALPGAAPEIRIGLHDRLLQAFLDGIPPKEARRLKTTGTVPDTAVWQLGDDLYIRTRADIRDEFEATLSSADGTHLWKLPVTPYVSFSVMGQTAALNVALE